jgi:hypothetical protein
MKHWTMRASKFNSIGPTRGGDPACSAVSEFWWQRQNKVKVTCGLNEIVGENAKSVVEWAKHLDH